MAGFYHITIRPKNGVSYKQVEARMNLAIDWFRYHGEECWIIYTSSNAQKWQARLKNLVDPGGRLFICKLDLSERQGWMNKQFWEWLRKDRRK